MKYDISLGDVSKVIYSGFLVDSATGEAIYWYEPQFDVYDFPNKEIECYRFTIAEDAIKDLNWLKLEDWSGVASFAGIKDIYLAARHVDIYERARVYEVVGSYYGFINLDGSPDFYTATELEAMYPEG